MRFRNSKIAFIMALLLIFALPVQATEPVEDLENTTSALQDDLSDLTSDLDALGAELDAITAQIQTTAEELEDTKLALAIAKGEEEVQYEAMTLRIKYLYENGNASILEMLFSSGSMAEFLNHAEYYASIMEYDRSTLEELQKTRDEIASKEQELLDKQAYLSSLEEELDAKEEALSSQIAATSADLSAYQAKLDAAREEAKRAEQSAQEEVDPIPPEEPEEDEPVVDESPDIPSVEQPSYSASASDLELFAALIECEAGSTDYEGMLAVASVVVNRMNSSYYPDTLRGVILQSGQFPPATNGKVDRVLERGIKDSCLAVAQDALNGKNNVGDCLQFRAASSGHAGTIIGDNVFF